MNNILEEYLNGINNFPEKKKLTPSSLCKSLNKDASSLKRSRIKDYPYLKTIFDEIDRFNENQNNNNEDENSIQREKRIKKIYKNERDNYEIQLKEAYAREVVLINRIDELERALDEYENKNCLKLLNPRK